jgi:hypothetical protein
MSTNEPQGTTTTSTATASPARRDLVEAWYDDPTQRPLDADPAPVAPAAPARPGAHTDHTDPAGAAVDTGVEEVARRVVKRLLDTEQAMLRHLEAIEAEAERRTDLLLAQAELDAELIRLNARREAHRIAMAGSGAGAPASPAVEADRRTLDELTDSLARFADEVDALHPSDSPASHRAP